MYLWAFLFWLLLLGLAIACGASRDLLLAPALGDSAARALETLILCAFDLLLIRRFVDHAGVRTTSGRLALGAFWTALVLLFEFGFGHYARGMSWDALLADYNVLRGRLWPLVPLVMLLGPLTARRPAP